MWHSTAAPQVLLRPHALFCRYNIGLNATEVASVLEWGGVELIHMPLSQMAEEIKHPRGHVLALPSSFAWKGDLQCASSLFVNY